MRRLLPDPAAPVTVDEAYGVPRTPPPGRPWVLLDMVASLDGATAVEGRAAGLGGPGDKAVFAGLRYRADVVLAGAETVRAEDYGPPKIPEEVQEARVLRGQAPLPRMAVISQRLDLPTDRRFFDAEPPPLVITSPSSSVARRTELAQRADLVLAGQGDRVDLGAALATLREMGHELVVCEGGPTLNGHLLDADLVDEICLTVAPLVVGGPAKRIVDGAVHQPPTGFAIATVLEHEGELFLRALRER